MLCRAAPAQRSFLLPFCISATTTVQVFSLMSASTRTRRYWGFVQYVSVTKWTERYIHIQAIYPSAISILLCKWLLEPSHTIYHESTMLQDHTRYQESFCSHRQSNLSPIGPHVWTHSTWAYGHPQECLGSDYRSPVWWSSSETLQSTSLHEEKWAKL